MTISGSERDADRGAIRCRVCAKEIRAGEARVTVHYRGAHYVVCCPSCARVFEASPEAHVGEP